MQTAELSRRCCCSDCSAAMRPKREKTARETDLKFIVSSRSTRLAGKPYINKGVTLATVLVHKQQIFRTSNFSIYLMANARKRNL